MLGLEDREEPGLLGESGDTDRVLRSRAPAERTGHEDVYVTGTVDLHRAFDLELEIVELSDRRGSHVRDSVRHGDARQVLSLTEHVARLRPYSLGRRGSGRRWRGAGALHAGVHVRLVVVADEQHVVVALEHPRQA